MGDAWQMLLLYKICGCIDNLYESALTKVATAQNTLVYNVYPITGCGDLVRDIIK